MEARKGEGRAPVSQARSRRFVQTEEGWYFRTRENIAVGPYPTEFDAEVSASLLVARLSQLEDQTGMNHAIQEFLRDPDNGPKRQPDKEGNMVAPTTKSWSEINARRGVTGPSLQQRIVSFIGKCIASVGLRQQ